MPADVTQQADVDALLARTLETCGRLDVLVNNAGRSAGGEILATSPAEFQAALELNFLAAVRCTRAAAPQLIASRGHLVNIASGDVKGSGLNGTRAVPKPRGLNVFGLRFEAWSIDREVWGGV